MSVKIIFENTLVQGEKRYKLKAIKECFTIEQLPDTYFNPPGDFFYLIPATGDYKARLIVNSSEKSTGDTYSNEYPVGAILEEKDLEWVKRAVERAGNRLHEINRDIDKLRATWEGRNETFYFVGDDIAARPIFLDPARKPAGHFTSYGKTGTGIRPGGYLRDMILKSILSENIITDRFWSSYGSAYVSAGPDANSLKPLGIAEDVIIFEKKKTYTDYNKIAKEFGGETVKLSNGNQAKIVFQNVLSRGMKLYKVVAIENVKGEDDLPVMYLRGETWFHLVDSVGRKCIRLKSQGDDISPNMTNVVSICVDNLVNEKMKGWIIRTMKKGALELSKVNKEVARLKEEWEGKTEVIKV